jgi:hypothetical protein
MDSLRAELHAASVPFRVLGRAQDVCEPCVGISGLRQLSRIGKFAYADAQHGPTAFDTDARLKKFWLARVLDNSIANIGDIKLGTAADVLAIDIAKYGGGKVSWRALRANPSTLQVNA